MDKLGNEEQCASKSKSTADLEWKQCYKCFKWRKVHFDRDIPSRWCCGDGDSGYTCDTPEEIWYSDKAMNDGNSFYSVIVNNIKQQNSSIPHLRSRSVQRVQDMIEENYFDFFIYTSWKLNPSLCSDIPSILSQFESLLVTPSILSRANIEFHSVFLRLLLYHRIGTHFGCLIRGSTPSWRASRTLQSWESCILSTSSLSSTTGRCFPRLPRLRIYSRRLLQSLWVPPLVFVVFANKETKHLFVFHVSNVIVRLGKTYRCVLFVDLILAHLTSLVVTTVSAALVVLMLHVLESVSPPGHVIFAVRKDNNCLSVIPLRIKSRVFLHLFT